MLDEWMLNQMTSQELNKQTTTLGVIGLGLMGSRFFRRLNAAGWNVRGWNRSKGVANSLRKYGFQVNSTLPSLVEGCEVLLSFLADDSAVEAVYLGKDGVFAHVRPQTILLEMSTISPGLSAILHEEATKHNVYLMDVAVSGSTPAVEAGTVTLFAGGEQETFLRCIPIFESIARQWFLMGPATAGVRMKLVVNLLLGIGMEAIAEAVSLGEYLRLNRDLMLEVLPKTSVVAPAFSGKFSKIRTKDYSPQFPLHLMNKDLNLAAAAAAQSGAELPIGRTANAIFGEALAESGNLDISSIAAYVLNLPTKDKRPD